MATAAFKNAISKGYTFTGKSILLGAAVHDNKAIKKLLIKAPLSTFNRHGLIAGATGTGKTKTIQLMSECLSEHGVPVLVMDLKSDLSGLAMPGKINDKIAARHKKIGTPFKPAQFPVEMLSLSTQKGVKLRATVSEFGPILFAKILGLNSTQTSVVTVIFKFCDDMQLPLLDLADFKKVLNFVLNEGKDEVQRHYGRISTTSASAILRKIIELEQQGAKKFFGEPSFEVEDLLRCNQKGQGYISILRLTDLQDRPKLFSTFMLCLLAEVYAKLPEVGDLAKPKLVIFIDEAHLLFKQASTELLAQLEMIVKLIRSKGVGLFFCTQNPVDIPNAVLSQLGMKVQHSLRAFTAKDRKAIKLVAENYPLSKFYKTNKLITSLGIGEAMITLLNEKGRPTPLAAVLLCAPRSRMGSLTKAELDKVISCSKLAKVYNKKVNRNSAYEILNKKMSTENDQQQQTHGKKKSKKEGWVTELSKNTMVRQMGRTLIRELSRSLLGVLSGK